MKLYRDEIQLDNSFPFKAYRVTMMHQSYRPESFHWHDFCEITLIRNGRGCYFVNGREYEVSRGDCIIFNNTEPHGWQVLSPQMDVIVIVFSLALLPELGDDYLKPFMKRGSSFKNMIEKNDPQSPHIREGIENLYGEFRSGKTGFKLMIMGELLRLISFLSRHYAGEESHLGELIHEKNASMKRIQEALEFIQCHYTRKITLADVAKQVNMSESYFSSYFKRVTQLGFMDYVSDLRVEKARYLMKLGEMNKNEIAMACGFNNMSNFYRILKKHRGSSD